METMPGSTTLRPRPHDTAPPERTERSGWTRHFRLRPQETYADRFRALLRAARQLGLGNGARALWYSVYRSRLGAADRQRSLPTVRAPRTPGRLQDVEEVHGGARFCYAEATLSVRLLAAGGVFIGWDGAEPLPSYALEPDAGAPEFDGNVTVTRAV